MSATLAKTAPLTPKMIEAARPKEKDYELADPAAPGLRLRVTPKGTKVFRWYVTSVSRVVTIGRWSKTERPGFVTLHQARGWLEKLKAAHREGRLDELTAKLGAELRPRRTAAVVGAGASVLTVDAVAEAFLADDIERHRKRPELVRGPLERDILPAIGGRAIGDIGPLDCAQIVRGVAARGAETQAGVVLAILKQLFNYACNSGSITANPAATLRPRALGVVKNTSQRFLTPDEIRRFWLALDAYKGMTPTVRNGLKLLLLLGCRTGELLRADVSQVDFDAAAWTVPVTHQKLSRQQERNARAWIVPLPPTALTLLGELRDLAKSLGSTKLMASFHPNSDRITDKALNHAMRRLPVAFDGERPTPHDLRRTLRTHLGDKLGVQFHVAERCLNHSLGKIASTYDVGDYVDERRAALEKWDAYVQRIVSSEAGRVAFLRPRMRAPGAP